MMFSLILRGYKKVLSRVHEYAWVTLFVSIALLYVLSCFVMFFAAEDQIFEKYTWWLSVTITTVGYGDYSPLTTYGRVCAGVIMFIGIGTAGLVIGKAAESVIDFVNKNRKGLRKMSHAKHTAIMGYRQGRAEKVIAELLSNNPAEKLDLCSFGQKENPIRFDIPPGNVAVDSLMVFTRMKKKYGATVLAVKDSHVTLNPELLLTVKSGMALFYAALTRLVDIDLAGLEV